MRQHDWIRAGAGLLLAGVGAAMVMIIMPTRVDTFISLGIELPLSTLLLLNRPWISLLMPALVLATALAWPSKRHRGVYALWLGAGLLAVSVALVFVAGYLPTWDAGAPV